MDNHFVKLENYKLAMCVGVQMEKSNYNKVTKAWDKTGVFETLYECTFVEQNLIKNRIVFLISKPNIVELEGTTGILMVKIGYDTFKKQNFVKFADYQPNLA